MQFEAENALRDLDQTMPSYFREELFAHGDLTVRKNSLEVLSNLDVTTRTVRVLIEMIRLIPT